MSYVLKGIILTDTKKGTTKKSTSKSTSSKTASKTASTRKTTKTKAASKAYEQTEIKENDPYFANAERDIALIIVIALGLLLMVMNFVDCGAVGEFISNILFGLFGIVQYIMPVLFVCGVFFFMANRHNKVAIAKGIAVGVLVLFITVIVELIIHGNNPLAVGELFKFSQENHYGGGIIGGLISMGLVNLFGIVPSYIISAVVMLLCLVLITETFIMGSVKEGMEYQAEVSEERRRRKRKEFELARDARMNIKNADLNSRREARRRANDPSNRPEEELEGPRAERNRNGILLDPIIAPTVATTNNATPRGDMQEMTYNLNEGPVTVTESKRTPVSSVGATSTSHSFFDNPLPAQAVTPVVSQPEIQPEVQPVVSQNPFKMQSSSPVIRGVDDYAEQVAHTSDKEPTTVSRATVTSSNQSTSRVSLSEPTYNPLKDTTAIAKESPEEAISKVSSEVGNAANKPNKPYKFPPLSLLIQPPSSKGDSKEYISEMSERLIRTLKNFGVDAQVNEVTRGPSVTRYEITIAEGTKVSKVVNLADDIKLNMAVTDLRMEAPIPGKSAIGIEVPNKEKVGVSLAELIKSQAFKTSKSKISFCVGKDITGEIIIGNIEKYPHVLIAGQTGSGKSVCINSIIMSILYHATPEEVKLIMVDPKQVELSVYNGIPHLLLPVVTDPKKAASTLAWACVEMDRRYKLLAKYSVRNLDSYNGKIASDGTITYTDENGETKEEQAEKLPQIVIILDELADLMMVAGKEVETSICRLAQLARAAGIHLVIATQRPTANVLTGLIKGNVPSRIAFSVASALDSRVILDENGAESLLGHGDMLYHPSGTNAPVRLQGAFVTDDEINNVVEFIKKNNEITAEDKEKMSATQALVEATSVNEDSGNSTVSISDGETGLDPLLAEAGNLIIESGKGSIGYLQRNFRIGFNRAARIMDQLCEKGVVGPELGTKPREIKMSKAEFEELLKTL